MSTVRDPQRDQPLPMPGKQAVQDVLIAAVAERRAYGTRKYGRPLETFNGRDALTDAWEEALDLVTYLTQARLERGDAITTTPAPATPAENAVTAVRAFADDMRTWCSPHGVATVYADRLTEVLDNALAGDTNTSRPISPAVRDAAGPAAGGDR
jgi:hypothetical protein